MMTCGGILLVLGFVIRLWTWGVFEDPMIVAAVMGATTIGTMLGGIALVRRTRYQLAGRGLTLLAALAMPLQLWFYDAQGILTLAEGGHLWIAAAICCLIYGIIARILRDPMFVYTLVAGVVLTGSLFLADQSINCFWHLLPHVTLLVVIGWICIVVERFFIEGDGDFSRSNFGRAFYRAGMVVLPGGLAMLLGGQIIALISSFLFHSTWAMVASNHFEQIWALGIVVASAIGFVVEHQSRNSRGQYAIAATGLSVWSMLCLMDALSLSPSLSHIAIGIGLLIAAANLFELVKVRRANGASMLSENSTHSLSLNVAGAIGLALGIAALGQFVAQFFLSSGNFVFRDTDWTVVVQLVTTSIGLWTTAFRFNVNDRHLKGNNDLARLLAWMGAVIFTLAIWTIGLTLGWSTVVPLAAMGLIVPVAAIAIGRAVSDESLRRGLNSIATVAVSTLLGCLAFTVGFEHVATANPYLTSCWILAVASAIYFVGAGGSNRAFNLLMGYGTATLATASAIVLAGVELNFALVAAPLTIGTILLVTGKLVSLRDGNLPGSDEGEERLSNGDRLRKSDSLQTGLVSNLLVLMGSVAGFLLTFTMAINGDCSFGLLVLLVGQLGAITVAGLITKEQTWRLTYRLTGLLTILGGMVAFEGLLTLHFFHRVELLAIIAGIAALVGGHIAWSHEGEKKDEFASMALTFGSLLVAIPLAIGLLFYRLSDHDVMHWMLFHEIAALVAGLTLFGAGMLCKLRSTTITGTSVLSLYVMSLVSLVQWPSQLQSISVVMMIGGGVFFGTAVLLSIYRDRVVALPSKIREGEGLFRVMKWR